MGQKQEVTTIRFCVQDTFEEARSPARALDDTETDMVEQRVTEIQDLKKTLASLISGPREGISGNEDRGPLEVSVLLYPCTTPRLL